MAEHRLAPGDVAPDFTLADADGAKVSLSDYRGQRVIIYFYPAAMTPGCTKQACDFRDSLASLAAAGLTVLGIYRCTRQQVARTRPIIVGKLDYAMADVLAHPLDLAVAALVDRELERVGGRKPAHPRGRGRPVVELDAAAQGP